MKAFDNALKSLETMGRFRKTRAALRGALWLVFTIRCCTLCQSVRCAAQAFTAGLDCVGSLPDAIDQTSVLEGLLSDCPSETRKGLLETISEWARANSAPKLLVITGRAGSGKSVAMALLTKNLDGLKVVRARPCCQQSANQLPCKWAPWTVPVVEWCDTPVAVYNVYLSLCAPQT